MKCFLLICLSLVTFSGCTTTADIHDNPQRYAGKTVVLTGTLSKRVPIPFTDLAVYVFDDNYGSALVLSGKEHTIDDQVIIKGTVTVFPAEGADKEMKALIAEIADFLVDNGWIEEKSAEKTANAAAKIFSVVIRGLGKAFIILESK